MTHKPDFWLAFKALSQIKTQMVNELVGRFYAFNAYYHSFYDKDLIMKSVLVGIPQADKIYSDEVFGLNSVATLYYWMQAIVDGGETSALSLYIQEYYKSKQIPFTPAHMKQLIGPKSLMFQIK